MTYSTSLTPTLQLSHLRLSLYPIQGSTKLSPVAQNERRDFGSDTKKQWCQTWKESYDFTDPFKKNVYQVYHSKEEKQKENPKLFLRRHFCVSLTYVFCEIGSVILLHQNNDCVGVPLWNHMVSLPVTRAPWACSSKGITRSRLLYFCNLMVQVP